jgi:peptidoglycan/xylan/chitin deacetylase (PgdA/CDA1 family)
MGDPSRTRHSLALSVDVDEWFHSRRWVEGTQSRGTGESTALCRALYGQDRPIGEVVAPTLALLDLLDRYRCRCTFFLPGEVAGWYPDLAVEIARRGHEIGCHGLYHVDMTALGPELLRDHLRRTIAILEKVTGARPVGYRAPNLVFEPWGTRVLEDLGFVYDSTVCPSRPMGGKYKGWAQAPLHPYHPSYEAVGRPGSARLVELPIPSFPVLRLAGGSGIVTRIIGLRWTLVTLDHAIRTGNTSYYFHPWEVGPRPRPHGHRLKNALFLRHTGGWMMRAVERILQLYAGRIVTAGESARQFLSGEGTPRAV